MATLCTPFQRAVDFHNPNQVKVVFSQPVAKGADGRPVPRRALYFSRSGIPFARDASGQVEGFTFLKQEFKKTRNSVK